MPTATTHPALTPTETACGVTTTQVLDLRRKVLIRGDRVILPALTAPALAQATARHALGVPVKYAGHNQFGQPVYRAA